MLLKPRLWEGATRQLWLVSLKEFSVTGLEEWVLKKQQTQIAAPATAVSRVRLVATPWTAAHRAPLSMRFPRQEYWSELPFPSPGDLPDPGIKPTSPMSPALAGRFFTTELPGKSYLLLLEKQFRWQSEEALLEQQWWERAVKSGIESKQE